MRTFRKLFILISFFGLLASCNVYTPFNTNGSDLDKLEEAQVCLKQNDWACALEQYQKLEDNTLKQQKLCQVYLSRGGITLSVLVNVLNQDSNKILVNLGNKLIPWTSNKSKDLDLAKTHCGNFNSIKSSADSLFLKSASLLAHCAIRMARADRFQSIQSDDTCTMANVSSNGFVEAGDICQSSDGSLEESGVSKPGMCSPDVSTCSSDIISVKNVAAELRSLGLNDLAGAAEKLPSSIVDSVPTTTARLALKGMFNR